MTNRNYITALFLVYSVFAQCQRRCGVFDFETKQPIQFCSLNFINYNDGMYTNKDGDFVLPAYLKNSDTIYISHLGYKTTILTKKTLKDSIFLTPKPQKLSEVIIKNSKPKEVTYGYKKGGNLSRALDKNQELAVLMKPKENCDNCYLNKIIIPITKHSFKEIKGKFKKVTPKFSTVMKLLIYSIEDGVPKDVLLKKPIFIKVNQDSSDDLEIDLGNEFIEFNSEGLFISFSKIESSNKAYNYLPLLRFTKKESKTVNSASFFRTIFGENKWKSIDKANLKGGIKKEYNLALKLEILEYK